MNAFSKVIRSRRPNKADVLTNIMIVAEAHQGQTSEVDW